MTFLGFSTEEWTEIFLSLVIVTGAFLLGRWLVGLLLDRLIRRAVGHTTTNLDDTILDAVRTPAYWLVLVIALDFALRRLPFVYTQWGESLKDILFVLYFTVAFVFAWRLTANLLAWYAQRLSKTAELELSEELIPLLRRLSLLILALIGLSILLGYFEVEITGLIATLGIGSLAIALAAQASLSDLFSGIVIMIDRPFRVGDRIELQDLDTWGDVTDLGLRSTRIRTRDNRLVIVPNSTIGKSLIVNHSFPNDNYRIEFHIGVGYDNDLEFARMTMIEAAGAVEGIMSSRPIEALLIEMAESVLVFRVRVWIQSYVDTRRITDKVNTAIYNALLEKGISMPYPQTEVHHHIDTIEPEHLRKLASAASGG